MNIEDYLRDALRPEEPQEGFAERILLRINRTTQSKDSLLDRLIRLLRPPRFGFVAAALLCTVLVVAFVSYRIRSHPDSSNAEPVQSVATPEADQTRSVSQLPIKPDPSVSSEPTRARRTTVRRSGKDQQIIAKQQLLLALQIASMKLNEVNRLLDERLYERDGR